MNKSESIQNLSAALSKAQAEMPAIKFDSKNPFLRNDYASLGAIIAGARPVIAKHGLSVSQLTFGEDGVAGVETVLMHTSGEWISQSISMPIGEEKGKSSAQVAGSIVTYLRRYSLASILGIYSDEDGDGNKPDPERKPTREAMPEPKPQSNDDIMTIEDACKVETSQGVKYGAMSITGLGKMLSAMWNQLKTNDLTDEAKAEIQHKIKAAQVVLDAKNNKEI